MYLFLKNIMNNQRKAAQILVVEHKDGIWEEVFWGQWWQNPLKAECCSWGLKSIPSCTWWEAGFTWKGSSSDHRANCTLINLIYEAKTKSVLVKMCNTFYFHTPRHSAATLTLKESILPTVELFFNHFSRAPNSLRKAPLDRMVPLAFR